MSDDVGGKAYDVGNVDGAVIVHVCQSGNEFARGRSHYMVSKSYYICHIGSAIGIHIIENKLLDILKIFPPISRRVSANIVLNNFAKKEKGS